MRRGMSVPSLICWIASTVIMVSSNRAGAQSIYNPRDDQFRTLGLMRAEAEYTRASADLARVKQLNSRGFATVQDVEGADALFRRSRVDYLQQALSVLSQGSHVTVVRAIKHRGANEGHYVSLTIGEAAGNVDLGHARQVLGDSSFDALRAGELGDVYVSVKAETGPTGAIIGWPYERRLGALRETTSRTTEFRLLRDLDEVVISVAHGDKVDERKILLEQDAAANLIAIDATQFSQEADLGTSVTFQLQLTRFARDEKEYHLQVDGLPADIAYEFRDLDTHVRLNQLRFGTGTNRKLLQLVISLPLRASSSFAVDAPIHLSAEALEMPANASFGGGESRLVKTPATTKLLAGRSRLELIPRGVARSELRAINLYHEIASGDSVAIEATVRNTGSKVLRDVRLNVDVPSGWTARVVPSSWNELPIGAESRVGITLRPAVLSTSGDYEARLRLESGASDKKVETEDKIVRVHVSAPREWFGTAALLGVVLATVAGVLALGLRLARR
jgi:hypothetical protein